MKPKTILLVSLILIILLFSSVSAQTAADELKLKIQNTCPDVDFNDTPQNILNELMECLHLTEDQALILLDLLGIPRPEEEEPQPPEEEGPKPPVTTTVTTTPGSLGF